MKIGRLRMYNIKQGNSNSEREAPSSFSSYVAYNQTVLMQVEYNLEKESQGKGISGDQERLNKDRRTQES